MLLTGCAKISARDAIRQGNAAYVSGHFEDALAAYDRSLMLEPEGVTVFWNSACAAEARMLQLQDPDQRQARAAFADRALADFATWLQRLDAPSEDDHRVVEEHRLSILAADARCDDLLAHWKAQHQAHPDEEAWYVRIVRQYAACGRPEDAETWRAKRTADFPRSVKAWHQRAVHAFEPLWPPEGASVSYNPEISAVRRLEAANRVIAFEDRALAIDPRFREAYTWKIMAYTQRRLARTVIEAPERPQERIEALRAREDAMLAWAQQMAICKLDRLPACDRAVAPPCCEPPPLSWDAYADDHARHVALQAQLLMEPTAAEEP